MGLKKRHLVGLLAIASVAALLPIPAAAAPTMTTVTTGLDSPRGIAFFHGQLVVGEAGHGGSDCFSPPIPGIPPNFFCVGGTSQVSSVNTSNGSHTPLVSGLFSILAGGTEALGVSGLSAGEDRLLVQIGFTPREAPASITLAQQQAGRLISVRADGTWRAVAPVGTVNFDYTTRFPEPVFGGPVIQGTQEHDANPYGVLATGDGALVADAGSNTLDSIDEDGHIKILIHDLFRPDPPTFPSDAVPTCVVRGENGQLLVGELSGRLLKVEGRHFTPIVLKDGAGNSLLTHVTGCTSDGQGNVYFVNMFGAGPVFVPPPTSSFFIGNVVRYNTETGNASILVNGLQFPNMDTIGPDGNLYVTVGSVCGATPTPGPCAGATGGVVRITLPHQEND